MPAVKYEHYMSIEDLKQTLLKAKFPLKDIEECNIDISSVFLTVENTYNRLDDYKPVETIYFSHGQYLVWKPVSEFLRKIDNRMNETTIEVEVLHTRDEVVDYLLSIF